MDLDDLPKIDITGGIDPATYVGLCREDWDAVWDLVRDFRDLVAERDRLRAAAGFTVRQCSACNGLGTTGPKLTDCIVCGGTAQEVVWSEQTAITAAAELRAENDRLKAFALALAERVAAQSELLSKRAERR